MNTGLFLWKLFGILIDVLIISVWILPESSSDLKTIALVGWVVVLMFDIGNLVKYVKSGE